MPPNKGGNSKKEAGRARKEENEVSWSGGLLLAVWVEDGRMRQWAECVVSATTAELTDTGCEGIRQCKEI
jgi:hypothetical protein